MLITPKPYISAAQSLKFLALQIQALQDPRNISALVPSFLEPYVQQAIDIPVWIKALVICSSFQSRYLPQHLGRILQRLIRVFMDQPIWLKISMVKLFIVCSLYLLLSLSYSQSSSWSSVQAVLPEGGSNSFQDFPAFTRKPQLSILTSEIAPTLQILEWIDRKWAN